MPHEASALQRPPLGMQRFCRGSLAGAAAAETAAAPIVTVKMVAKNFILDSLKMICGMFDA